MTTMEANSVQAADPVAAAQAKLREARADVAELGDPRLIYLLSANDERRQKFELAREAALTAEQRLDAARIAARAEVRPRSPAELRADLAEAIAVMTQAEQAVSQIRSAMQQAEENERAAHRDVQASEAEAEKVKAGHIEAAEQAAREGRQVPSSSSLREANTAAADAREQLEIVRQAAARAAEKLPDQENILRRARKRVDVVAADVIRAEAPVARLVQEARALQNELNGRRAALRFLLAENLVSQGEQGMVQKLLRDVKLPGAPGDVEFVDWSRHATAEPWRKAKAALVQNPSAPLPV